MASTTTQYESVSKAPFYFDTCETAHKCPYPELFESLDLQTDTVKSSSGQGILISGIGTIFLKCLSDGSVVDFKNFNFLHVPELTC